MEPAEESSSIGGGYPPLGSLDGDRDRGWGRLSASAAVDREREASDGRRHAVIATVDEVYIDEVNTAEG